MAKDPICGMTVDEATACRAERSGQTFYFCCEHCREKFLAQPIGRSLKAEESPSCCGGSGGKEHAAPGGEGRHNHSQTACCASKPGMNEPHGPHSAVTATPSASAKYFCPMCPGMEAGEPGDCPKCGMALERNPAWVAPTAGKTIYTCPMH